jgi:hypothetical protein
VKELDGRVLITVCDEFASESEIDHHRKWKGEGNVARRHGQHGEEVFPCDRDFALSQCQCSQHVPCCVVSTPRVIAGLRAHGYVLWSSVMDRQHLVSQSLRLIDLTALKQRLGHDGTRLPTGHV